MSPAVSGVVESRILVNFRVGLDTLDTVLPEPFRGREVGETGVGIGTVCFTKVTKARPWFVPESLSVGFETATHRISAAVEGEGGTTFCVYVPQREVSSRFCSVVGGFLLPTDFDRAEFQTKENDGARLIRADGIKFAGAKMYETDRDGVNDDSVFYSLESASKFLCEGGVEYSKSGGGYGGVEFRTDETIIEPIDVTEAHSSYFEKMGARFDSAFRMRDVEGKWIPRNAY